MFMKIIPFFMILSHGLVDSAKLGTYNVDADTISVSGLSAGGYMAVQMHIANSKLFMGMGCLAAGPYYCAQFNLFVAQSSCMTSPSLINVGYLQQITRNTALTGFADPLSNLVNDRVYFYSGTEDSVVVPGVVKANENYYSAFVDTSNIKTVYGIESEHCFPTADYGGTCKEKNSEYINKCNYDAAYDLLNHIYPGLQQPTSVLGQIYEFDQEEFVSGFADIGLDSRGYVFVPDSCTDKTKKCRLHLALHGCLQGREYIGDSYFMNTGYNEVASSNDIIVIYPQVKKNESINPYGCFDWWGYTGSNYASNTGKQIVALRKMIERVANM